MLRSTTEVEAAAWWSARGLTVVSHRGRFWKRTRLGFYEPIHWMARLSSHEASPPNCLHWGFRTTLHEAHRAQANATLPLHLLSDLGGYTLERFQAKRRFHIRKSQRLAHFEVLDGPALLHEQGYEVYRSARLRIGSSVLSRAADHARLDDPSVGPVGRHAHVGVVNGRLAAYLTAFAVTKTAYIENLYLASEYMATSIGSGLVYEFVQTCRRLGVIEQVVYGPHVPDASGLSVFKVSMGFPVRRIPSRMWLAPLVRDFVRRRHAHAYYMITGVAEPVPT